MIHLPILRKSLHVRIHWMLIVSFLIPTIKVSCQQAIELASGSYPGTIPLGPTTASQTAIFRNNSSGTVFDPMTNPISVTASLSNQQFTGVAGNASSGITFGAALADYTNNPDVLGIPVFSPLATVGLPASASYTSNPYGTAGTGISVFQNYGFSLFSNTNMWIGTTVPPGARPYYADITFSFSRPVSDPVLQISGWGAHIYGTGNTNYSTEFELPPGSGLTLTKLSGSAELIVPASNDKILNGAAVPDGFCGLGAACGSVRVNGTNISSVTFRIYVRFATTAFPPTFIDGGVGDVYQISLSLATFNLSGTVYNDANGLTDNTVNGTVTNAGNRLYAIAVDAFGKVKGSTAVSATGAFTFTNLVKGSYTVRLSTSDALLGSNASSASIPSGWIYTGEFRGVGAGSDGTIDGNLSDNILTSDITNFNLGIERIPTATNIFYQLDKTPAINSVLALNGAIGSIPIGYAPIRPNGIDPEDGVLSSGNTLIINTLASFGTLLYNNIPITAGQVITGFNPALLAVRFNGAGYKSTSFTYSYRDAASMTSLPATYTIVWDAALPVTLTAFTAIKNADNSVLLKWETASEQHNRGFNVQHSIDCRSWEILGFVKGAGNSDNKTNYDYLHHDAGMGIHYYRLQQVDLDGFLRYSSIRQVSFGVNRGVQIFPNPATDKIHIVSGSGVQIKEVCLVDMTGRRLLHWNNLQDGSQINISRLPAATYLLEIQLGDEEHYYKKIIKR